MTMLPLVLLAQAQAFWYLLPRGPWDQAEEQNVGSGS